MRYAIETRHSEIRTIHHIVDTEAPESEQPAIVTTVHDLETAKQVQLHLESQPTVKLELSETKAKLLDRVLAFYLDSAELGAERSDAIAIRIRLAERMAIARRH